MKFSKAIVAAVLLLTTSVQACIRVHVVQNNHPLFGDGMRVQIWDNDDFYEVQGQGKRGASGDTHWGFQFGAGHYVELWRNGKEGFVALQNGWRADFHLINTDFDKNCVIDSDNGCRVYETIFESCLNDNFGNCGGYTCGLCGGNDCPR